MTDPYLTAADLTARYPELGDVDTDDLDDLIAEFEEWVEEYRGTAYLVRSFTETVWTDNPNRLPLSWPHIATVDTITYADGSTAPDTANVIPSGRSLTLSSGYWRTNTDITVTYTAGHAEPPRAILRACREFARAEALQAAGNIPRNSISWTDPDQGVVIRESTADASAGRPSKWLVVMEAVNQVPDESPVLAL